ncbi:hypothetical protein HPP92_012049 [Vanilla planifolia]|uniref:Uncharacterized protein n=1 Tax=Vanilla planifolia TaxID=51239 RepID=A0A835R1X9_VANPL|nr:hypothetical protein HPP92_012049 [Vanilla planifolia]
MPHVRYAAPRRRLTFLPLRLRLHFVALRWTSTGFRYASFGLMPSLLLLRLSLRRLLLRHRPPRCSWEAHPIPTSAGAHVDFRSISTSRLRPPSGRFSSDSICCVPRFFLLLLLPSIRSISLFFTCSMNPFPNSFALIHFRLAMCACFLAQQTANI